jgi:hypothetical protein
MTSVWCWSIAIGGPMALFGLCARIIASRRSRAAA